MAKSQRADQTGRLRAQDTGPQGAIPCVNVTAAALLLLVLHAAKYQQWL
jgi:hypothetical protein